MTVVPRVIVFVVGQVILTYPFVFRSSNAEFHGEFLYSSFFEDIKLCLRSCYDEMSCTYVAYGQGKQGLCELYANGNETITVKEVYMLSRQETDSTCQALKVAPEIAFRKIAENSQRDSSRKRCHPPSNVSTFSSFYSNNFSFYFEENSKPPMEGISTKYRLRFSSVAGLNCSALPVFIKTLPRRFYFGSIYNTTGYHFAKAYAFADKCVSEEQCLGTQEIQEYKDDHGNYIYDKPGKAALTESGLHQILYVVSVQTE